MIFQRLRAFSLKRVDQSIGATDGTRERSLAVVREQIDHREFLDFRMCPRQQAGFGYFAPQLRGKPAKLDSLDRIACPVVFDNAWKVFGSRSLRGEIIPRAAG